MKFILARIAQLGFKCLMKKLYLIGYEGSDADRLFKTLKNVGVQTLADVRELPLSRKKGLSKKSLGDSLEEIGIKYLHFRDLGDPKAGRDAARAGNYTAFERIFLSHLASDKAQGALEELLRVANDSVTCLLCFERCSDHCHRSYIADIAAMQGFEIYSLVADRPNDYLNADIQIPRYRPRESVTAAE